MNEFGVGTYTREMVTAMVATRPVASLTVYAPPGVEAGLPGVVQALQAGCNDLGGTLIDENISRAAGASHGQRMDEATFRSLVEPLGRRLEQRTTLYGRVAATT